MAIACGRCFGCRVKRGAMWAARMMQEAASHEENSFITLTYAEEPRDGSLDVRDWQLFAKRLRRRLGRFRFFHCGEYGEERNRPHYHAVLFGLSFPDRRGNQSELLDDIWGKGITHVDDVTYESCAYVASYVLKKLTGPKAVAYEYVDEETGEVRRRQPEYSTKSLRPGIARSWYEKYKAEIWRDDSVIVKGREVTPPRYFLQLLKDSEPELAREVSRKRKRSRPRENGRAARLEAEEAIALSRFKLKRGKL